MKKGLKIFSACTFKEALILVYALFLDSLYKHIPKRTFLIKNTYDFLLANGGEFKRIGEEVRIFVHGLHCFLRLNGSDFMVFNQLVIGKGLKRLIEIVKSLPDDRIVIFDCGANIGVSTLLLKSEFRSARIVAIEPEAKNFEQLKKNIQINEFESVFALNIGVWYEKSRLAVDTEFRDKLDWSYSLKPSVVKMENTIEVNTIQDIAIQFGFSRIDVLKIDIEGSEFALFRNLKNWENIFETVKVVSIEPHEERGKISELLETLRICGFTIEYYQELIIGTR